MRMVLIVVLLIAGVGRAADVPGTQPGALPIYRIHTIRYRATVTFITPVVEERFKSPTQRKGPRPDSMTVVTDVRVDCDTGRRWEEATITHTPATTMPREKMTTVCDGETVTVISELKKNYSRRPITGAVSREQARKLPEGLDWFTGIDHRGVRAEYVGRETVNDISCDVWSRRIVYDHPFPDETVMMWVAAEDGRPVRSEWKRKETTFKYEVLSVNKPLEREVFTAKPPEGYEELPLRPQPMGGRGLVREAEYRMPDRSLVLATRVGMNEAGWDVEAVQGLKFGDVVEALSPWYDRIWLGDDESSNYVPHHLAVTRKGGTTYLWTLFVRNVPPPESDHVRYGVRAGGKDVGRIGRAYQIRSREDFKDILLARMAELSDAGTALPPEVTFNAVTKLEDVSATTKTTAPAEIRPAN